MIPKIGRNTGVVEWLTAQDDLSLETLRDNTHWREIILDICWTEDPGRNLGLARKVLGTAAAFNTLDGCITACAMELSELPPKAREKLCDACGELLVNDCLWDSEVIDREVFEGVLLLSRACGGIVSASILVWLVEKKELSGRDRELAANALLGRDFRNRAPIRWWRSLDIVKCPEFAHPLIKALLEYGQPLEALEVLLELEEPDAGTKERLLDTIIEAAEEVLAEDARGERLFGFFMQLSWGEEFERKVFTERPDIGRGRRKKLLSYRAICMS